MAVVRKYGQRSLVRTYGTTVDRWGNSTFVLEVKNTPGKASGSFILYPDGSRFRRSTNRSLSSAKLEVGASEVGRGSRPKLGSSESEQLSTESNPGGYFGDLMLTPYQGYAFKSDGLGLSSTTSVPSIPTNRRNEAVTKALNRLADQKVNSGENLGQLRQTLRMLTKPVSSLAESLYAVHRRREFDRLRRHSVRRLRQISYTDSAARRYLEYVYGWKPLMQDIRSIVEMAKDQSKPPLFLSATGTSKQQEQRPDWSHVDTLSKSRSRATQINIESRVACNLWARIDPNTSGLRTLNQLGLLNPVGLAWELATFSFVVDWVLPIGPVLNALTAPAGLLFVDGSISNRITASCNVETYYDGWGSSASWDPSPGSGTVTYEGYRRDVIRNWPLPGFWFDTDPLRGDRPLKALALFVLGLSKLSR